MLKFLKHRISSFLAITIITTLAILTGLSIFYWSAILKLEQSFPSPIVRRGRLKIPSDWEFYKNEILGISFYYPPQWGRPYTQPTEFLTDLAKIREKFKDKKNYFAHKVEIIFPKEKTPKISFYDKEYQGPAPTFLYQKSENIDNFSELKKNKDICIYQIKFKTDESEIIKQPYSKCHNKIKTSLIRVKKGYLLFDYNLAEFAFIKLKNGFFDNAFVEYLYAFVQSKDGSLGLTDFLKKVNFDYKKNKENFRIFLKSIKVFKPTPPEKKLKFKILQEKDPNIATIRQYYFEITMGNLEKAYNFYREKKVTFETYKSWYQDTFIAFPFEFKKIRDNLYQFKVHFQAHNQSPELYRVVMEVKEGKIIPLSSEKIIGKPVSFGKMKAFIKQRFSSSYLVLSENGKEEILDKGGVSILETLKQKGRPLFSGTLKFSSKGNYLIAEILAWEWSGINVYDLKKRKKVLQLDSPFVVDFTKNEKYLFACAQNDLLGVYYAKVYSLAHFREVYSAFAQNSYAELDCDYDSDNQVIIFKIYKLYNRETKKIEEKTKIIEFSEVSGKISSFSL